MREVTCKVLQSAGYRVVSTQNAADAKRKFRRCSDGVELLLTDVVLPDRNGLTLANDLRTICPTFQDDLHVGLTPVLILARLLATASSAWVCARKPAQAA